MFEAYSQLDPFLKAYWIIAIFSSLVFIIQSIMTFIGLGGDDGTDAEMDGDGSDLPLQIFSFRNLIHFLLGFSWTGISLYNVISNKIVLSLISLAVGICFILLFFLIIKQLMKLAENNSFKIEDTIGKSADVYLPIPQKREGKGKVMVSVKGAVHELGAVTDYEEKIETGSIVEIVAVSHDIVIVTKI